VQKVKNKKEQNLESQNQQNSRVKDLPTAVSIVKFLIFAPPVDSIGKIGEAG
jgi:hypothetical protein